MKLSQLFTKTLREDPKDETSTNAKLLSRGGFIFKNMSGVYSLLPLGVRVAEKIKQIIREEMNAIGGQEVFLNALQDAEIWKKTGRWEEAKDVMYRFSSWDSKEPDVGLGFTHEEVVAQIGSLYIQSYKDLPKFVYQIQTKFRREPRSQSGLIRGREFEMKDLYSLTATEDELHRFYEKAAGAYEKIFKRLGLKAIRTSASGGLFSKGSDEFQVLADVGEDTIYLCDKCDTAINKEIIHEKDAKCPNEHRAHKGLNRQRAIEVGNIFKLGTKFSEPLGLVFTDKDGRRKPVWMGSYGIGIGRAMATIVEIFRDDKGIIWPESVAPFAVHLIALGNSAKVGKAAGEVYKKLSAAGIEALYDDRDVQAGEKFADADLIGAPWRVVVSEKTLAQRCVELKARDSNQTHLVKLSDLPKKLGLAARGS